MATFLQNLPNNGARYGTKRNSDDIFYCQPYIAWHDTSPPNNIYCKVNKMNHLERSLMLRNKLEKMERLKKEKMSLNNFQRKRRRILNRKRKKPMNNNNNNIRSKRRRISKRNTSKPLRTPINKCNSKDKDFPHFLMSQVRKNTINNNFTPEQNNQSLFDSLNNLPKYDNNFSANIQKTFDKIWDSNYDNNSDKN
eukprot:466846_1